MNKNDEAAVNFINSLPEKNIGLERQIFLTNILRLETRLIIRADSTGITLKE